MSKIVRQHIGNNKKDIGAENSARSRERKLRLAAAIAPSLALTVASLSPFDSQTATAATLTWDGGDATFNGSYGGSGTWDLSTLNWSNASADQAWVDTSGTSDTAVFTGTAGTVAPNANLGALGLQFLTTGYTLSGSGTLTLGAGGINASTLTSGTTTISNAVSLLGAQPWTLGSGATLSVGGTVTHNVGSTINFSTNGTFNGSGLLSAVGTQVAGWATIGGTDFAVSNGTKVAATSYTSVTGSVSPSGASAQNWETTGVATLSASGTINSANVVGGDLAVGSNTLTLASGGLILGTTERWVSGTGGTLKSGLSTGELYIYANTATFTNGFQIQPMIVNGSVATAVYKQGSGQMEMGNGGNTFSGGFYLNAGTVYLGASSTGSGASVTSGPLGIGTVTLNGGTLNLSGKNNGTSTSGSYTLGNNVNVPAGASAIIDNGVNNGTLGGNFTGSGTLTIQNSSGVNLSDSLNGSWSGFTGTLNYKTISSVVNIFGGTIDLSNAAVNVSGSNSSSTFRVSGTAKLGSLAGSSGYLDSSGGSFQIGNLGTSTTFAGTIVGTGSISKVGTGSLTLSGGSTYSAGTTIENGALVAGAAVALSANGPFGNSSSAIALGDATSISSNLSPSLLIGGAFGVGRSITVGSSNTSTTGIYTIGGVAASNSTFSGAITLNQGLSVSQVSGGTVNLIGNITSGSSGTQTLTFSNVGSVTQSTGVIGGGTGTIAIAQTGAGTTTLTGANTYAGGTTINGGTLRAANSSALGTGSADVKATIAVGADSTHPGLLNINNASQASTWEAGANYAWKTDSATGTAGTNFDQINMTSLNVTASNSSPFTIILSDLSAAGGTVGTAPAGLAAGDSWILATTSTTAQINGANVTSGALLTSGLSSDVFALSTSNFDSSSGPVSPSGFSLDFVTSGSGDNLVLTYTAAPEPGTAMLVLTGGLPMLAVRRRRRWRRGGAQ